MVAADDGAPDWDAVRRLIGEWLPSVLVVGLPLDMDGGESYMAVRARKFGARASAKFGLEVVYVDERLSTVAADNLLADATTAGKSLHIKRRKHRDKIAAELIVQTYLRECVH